MKLFLYLVPTLLTGVALGLFLGLGLQGGPGGNAAAEIYRGESGRELVNRGDHVETLVRSWMKREPIAASTWVTTIPEASDKDRAVGVIIDEVLERDGDVEMARKWVSEIADPAVAEEISRKVEQFDK